MTWFTDGDKTADITLIGSNDAEFQDDFYDVGELADLAYFPCYGTNLDCYCVEDVDYLIDQAQDMIAGKGDFDQPQPDVTLTVVWTGEDEDCAAMLDYIKAHGEAVKSSAEAGHPCLDKGLFAAACDAYEMFSDAKGYDFWLELNCGGPIGIGVSLGDKSTATVYATTPDGRHELCWKAYEDFRDFGDVADWLDECQQTAYVEYMPEELKER